MSVLAPRYWVPEGGEIPLVDDGFMPDPSGWWSGAYVPESRKLDSLLTPCLILIGEPGLGKTTALKTEFSRVSEQIGVEDRAHWVSLGGTRDRRDLAAQIFKADAFKEWVAGEGRLHLFLDSLDEARVHITRVAELLIEGLQDVPVWRLVLRLSCRSADRHHGLESQLEKRFAGQGEFAVRELAPLTKRDVIAAAIARGLEGEEILGTIIERGLQPLAMIPESLNFLLDSASRTGQLPVTRAEAFASGLLLLADEGDEDRRREGEGQIRGGGARLALASRIAAALVLSGRTAVRIDTLPPSADDATLAQLAGGHELDREAAIPPKVEASAVNLAEVLGTSIFTSYGEGRFGFGQASYAEYLCARWLASGALSTQQIEDLLFMDTGERLRVVPQLHEVASWLAAIDKDFFRRLLDLHPTVLLRADPTGLDDSSRSRLVDALLAGVEHYEIGRWDRRHRAIYPRLKYAGLAEQLREIIFNPSVPSVARQVACDLAGACELTGLEDRLVDLALDPEVDLQVRIAALTSLARFAGPAASRKLRPLGLEPIAEDEDDELKGAALRILWPGAVTATELFSSLEKPKRKDLYGLYKDFLLSGVLEGLDPGDLPVVLRWAAQLPIEHFPTDPMSSIREQALVRAWPLLREGNPIADPFVEVVAGLLARDVALLSTEVIEKHTEVFKEEERRRLVLSHLIARAPIREVKSSSIVFSSPRLLHEADTEWLVGQLEDQGSEEAEELCARLLIAHATFGGGGEGVLLEARETNEVLRNLTKDRYEAIRLGSTEAVEARKAYELHLRIQREDEEELDPLDIAGNVRTEIDRFEAGEVDGFWIATKWLEIHPERRQHEFFTSDLAELPGWEQLDESDRRRVRSAALLYLEQDPPDPSGWFARQGVNWPATAGYRALRFVYEDDRLAAEALPSELWARWAPIIVDWWRNDGAGKGEGEFNDWTIAELMSRAPEAAVMWFERRLDRDLRGEGQPVVLHRFRNVWHPMLERAVLARARRTRLGAEQRAELLRALLRNDSAEGRDHARRLVVPAALKSTPRRRELAVRIAALLAIEGDAAEWDRIWALVLSDQQFGEELIESLALGERQVVSGLSPRQAGGLYSWMLERFPRAEDPQIEGAHSVSPREQVGHWRDRIPGAISALGTSEAVEELARLGKRHPDHPYLVRLKREAESLLQESEWIPPSPEAVIVLADDASRRHVRSPNDLRRVLLSSLKRAQTKLGGTKSTAQLLWDTRSGRPKSEREVAHWVEEHLREDLIGRGVIVDREVELKPHPKGHRGKAVDLFVTAVAGAQVEGSPIVSVSVELKCCWHADLDTAMRDQLVSRYLDAENSQGIYLVAQFDSPDWTQEDNRNRSRCRRRTVEEARRFFEEQANAIGGEGLADVSAFVLDCSLVGA